MRTGKSKCSSSLNSWTTDLLVYINSICSNLSNFNNFKLFADDTSFSVVKDASETFENVTSDLPVTSE